MRSYNIDMQGKFLLEKRNTPSFSINDVGRLLYDDVENQLMFQDITSWNKVWTEANVDELMTALESLTGSLGGWDRVGTVLVPKEPGDTVEALGIDTTNFTSTNAIIDNLLVNNQLYCQQVVHISPGTTETIDWSQSLRHAMVLNANCTLTFIPPAGATNLLIVVQQDATGSRTITWPGSVRWVGNITPTLSTAPGTIDIVGFYYNGTSYYGTLSKNFGV